MELLTPSGTGYLLDATLEALHAESVAWRKDLDFWSDEIAFFYTLVHHDKLTHSFPSHEVADVDSALVTLNAEKLDSMKNAVTSHERRLATLLRAPSPGDEKVYRDTHRQLRARIYSLNEDIRAFKRKVFSMVEK